MNKFHPFTGFARSQLWCCLIASLLTTHLSAFAAPAVPPDQAGYQKIVQPFFNQYCKKCHADKKPEGDFSVMEDKLINDFSEASTRSPWKEVVNVLNSHEMPPEKEKQPTANEVATVVDWITTQMVRAELYKRETTVTLRRLNREEYQNTIRDLVGVDIDVSGFPQDPPAGGFDNNGSALTLSPLHLELYLQTAQQIFDRALVEGEQPPTIKWRFEPKVGAADRVRKRLDPKNNPIVNGGNNKQEDQWVVIHHDSWDKKVGARDFRVPVPGVYHVRVHSAGRTPGRDKVVESASIILKKRQEDQDAKNPKGKEYTQKQYERDLEHFKSDRMYDYGPPRMKLVLQLGPQPKTLAEFDVTAQPSQPQIYEFPARFTTETGGVHFEYAYEIPKVLENFWMQGSDFFARPELMIDWFEIEGPVYDSWPPSSHQKILPNSSVQTTNELQYVKNVLTSFMRKAYRRPVLPAEVEGKIKLFSEVRKDRSFVQAIKHPLCSILTSPHFLYLTESQAALNSASRISLDQKQAAADKLQSLDDHEIATRLSYFLWSSMPDDELFQLADSGQLKKPATLRQQVDRMLKDKKSQEFVDNFTGQWLSLREVGANPPAKDLYPQYDRHLETSIVKESQEYFAEFLQHDLDMRKMIRSDFVTINERLARFYGIPNVRGDVFQKVSVSENGHRGGIVTQASILTITSNGTRTSPVKRGTWILKTLLGIDPGLPVANAGEIAPKVPGIDKATVRKRLEIHRELPQCARCHSKIDPLGFALENYNAAGEWREQEGFGYKGRIEKNDPKIDASSKMPDGTEINGVLGLQQAMLLKEDLFLTALTTKMFTYAMGREIGLSDQPLISNAVKQVKQQNYTLRSLIHSIVTSDAFLSK